MNKIILHGTGGQGVKLLANVLATILAELDYNITLTYSYDAAVRGGNITAYLKYSKDKIENPIIDKADIVLMLSKAKGFSTKKLIIEEAIKDTKINTEETSSFPFTKLSSEIFKSPVFINMICLGKLLKELNIDYSKIKLKEILPDKFLEENIKAIELGFNLK